MYPSQTNCGLENWSSFQKLRDSLVLTLKWWVPDMYIWLK